MSIKSLTSLAWNKIENFSTANLAKSCTNNVILERFINFINSSGKPLMEQSDSHLANRLMTIVTQAKMRGKPKTNEKVCISTLEPMIRAQEKTIISSFIPNPEKPVENGYGEFVVFSKDSEKVSQEAFEKAYSIFCRYSPGEIAKHCKGNDRFIAANYKYRHAFIRKEVKEIDPDLEIAFVPRTLYELVFIHKCIKEDLKRGEACALLDGENLKDDSELKSNSECWHLVRPLTTPGNLQDMQNGPVIQIAYRLNHSLAKKFRAMSDRSFQNIAKTTEKEIGFLKLFFQGGWELTQKARNGEKLDYSKMPMRGPAINFRSESTRHPIISMGLRDETDATLIRKMLAIDCSLAAQKALFLSRGANFSKDSPKMDMNEDVCKSLSFGSSLFAGVIFDPGACSFRWIRGDVSKYCMNQHDDGYVLSIPIENFYKSPFYIPPVNALCQLNGLYEDWHGRTKIWKEAKYVSGVSMMGSLEHLKSDLTKDELLDQFQKYKNAAFILKKA